MGCPGNAKECAVARAAVRVLGKEVVIGCWPGKNYVMDGMYMWWETNSGQYVAHLPEAVTEMITYFDLGSKHLKPLEFEITPEPYAAHSNFIY